MNLHRFPARLRDVRLFWKLLVPFLLLMLVMGLSGGFLTVRYLSSRAQADLDHRLERRSVAAAVYLNDEALYLLESVRFAANIQGVADAVESGNRVASGRLLASVPAVRSALDVLVATDNTGTGLVEMTKDAGRFAVSAGGSWGGQPFVAQVLAGTVDKTGDKNAGLLRVAAESMLAVAGPIRTDQLKVVGSVIAGMSARTLAGGAALRAGVGPQPVALYATTGRLLASSGISTGLGIPPPLPGNKPVRRRETVGGSRVATLYAPFEVRDIRLGTLAVALPLAPAFADVRGAAFRLTLILLLAMAVVVALGALLSQYILSQIRPLVATNRALGAGDLSARARVLANDELGELAKGLNAMADQLQASYELLEGRVQARTEELQRLYEELVKATEARAKVFSEISHEFRNPLFAIIGHADLMLDSDFRPSDATWREDFGETIKEAGSQLLQRVNEILDLAKLESGAPPALHMAEVRLADVVGEIRRTIIALAQTGELDAEIGVPADLPSVEADPVRLKQVILNLVSNAVKYTPAGGRVTVAARVRNGRVEVSVSDTGVGIDEAIGDRIFEPFYQAQTSAQKSQASTGLGLALAKRLVEAHGGVIWYTSRPGSGSTFAFTLPPARVRGQRARNRPRRDNGSESGGRSRSVVTA